MKKILISSALTLSAIIASVSAHDPAPVQYVASVKKNVTGTGRTKVQSVKCKV